MSLEDNITETAIQLISIPSITSSHLHCKEILDYVEKRFEGSNYKVTRFETNRVGSLIVSKKDGLEFDMTFLGHLDVVPSDKRGFEPREEGDILYGRGAIDMKSQCAIMIELFLAHREDPRYENAALVLTTDEEFGGNEGAGYLVEEKGLKTKVLVNPDGGDEFALCVSEKGILHLRLTAEGVSAHGSRPWEGANALELLLEDIERMKACYPLSTAENPLGVSVNVGQIEGGKVANVVPNYAIAKLDIRYPPELDGEEVTNRFFSCVANSHIEIINHGPAISITPDNPAFKLFQAVLNERGYSNQPVKACGASDARWFVSQGASILLCKPSGSGFHEDNECVSKKSLVEFYKVLERFMERCSELKNQT